MKKRYTLLLLAGFVCVFYTLPMFNVDILIDGLGFLFIFMAARGLGRLYPAFGLASLFSFALAGVAFVQLFTSSLPLYIAHNALEVLLYLRLSRGYNRMLRGEVREGAATPSGSELSEEDTAERPVFSLLIRALLWASALVTAFAAVIPFFQLFYFLRFVQVTLSVLRLLLVVVLLFFVALPNAFVFKPRLQDIRVNRRKPKPGAPAEEDALGDVVLSLDPDISSPAGGSLLDDLLADVPDNLAAGDTEAAAEGDGPDPQPAEEEPPQEDPGQ